MIENLRTFFLSTPKRRAWTLWGGITALFAVISWFYMGSALTSCSAGILGGGPGDGTAGLTWLSWMDKAHGTPLPGFTTLTNAPFGESLRQPFQITSAYTIPLMWLLAKLTTATCSWNLMVFIGYMSSALVMFAFVRWLLRNNLVAFFAGFAVTFVPYHQFNAQGHLSYMFNALFVLLIWAFILFWRQPTWKKSILFGVATAACMYLDGYFILLTLVLTSSVLLAAILADTLIFKRPPAYILARIKGILMYIVVTIVCLLPIAFILLKDSGQISTTLASSRGNMMSEATVYSARPLEYLLPADNTPFLPSSYETWRQQTLHGSNFTESSIDVGVVVFVLGVASWVWWFRNRQKPVVKIQKMPLPFLLGVLSFALFAAFMFSMPPVLHLFGHKLPMPSWFILHVSAMWRVFARLFVIVDTCLVILASIGLYLLIRKFPWRRQVIATFLVTLLVFMEFMTQSRGVTWSYKTIPAVYPWLATQSQVKIIAEYPLGEPPSQSISDYLTYQQISDKAIFNTSDSASPQRDLHLSMSGLADAQTLPILRTLGINMVLSHRTAAPSSLNNDLQFVRYDASHYNDDNVWTYKILPGEKASYALVTQQGFHAPVIDKNLHSKIGMGSLGTLAFQKLTPGKLDPLVHVSLTADSEQGDQLVTVAQNGIVRWQGTVSKATQMSFDADPSVALSITPYHPTADETMQIYDLKAIL